jgi:hypothetical protein
MWFSMLLIRVCAFGTINLAGFEAALHGSAEKAQ